MYIKRILISLLIAIISILISPNIVGAHPIDNSDSYFYFVNEIDGSELGENEGIVYTYINWFQAGLLVEAIENVTVDDITKLQAYQDLYERYVSEKLNISNNEQACEQIILNSPITDEQISLSLGTRVIMQLKCNEPLENIKIENDMMVEYFELPSNFVQIYIGDDLLYKTTLGKNNTEIQFNLSELISNPQGDVSLDYSKDYAQDQLLKNGESISEETNVKKGTIFNQISDLLFLKIDSLKDQSIFIILVLVFLLGLLHTLEAGHSKAILASVMINDKMSYKGGILYAAIFTATHLADIVILGVIFFIADNFFNIYSRFALLENIAAYTLFFISTYILVKSIRNYLQSTKINPKKDVSHALLDSRELHEHEHKDMNNHSHSHEVNQYANFKEQIGMAVLAGLAPCVFGWSIFMVVLSSKQTWTIFPIVLAFGLGIFVALLLVVFIITKLRKPAYKKFSKFASLSPIISGVLLVSYSILLILR